MRPLSTRAPGCDSMQGKRRRAVQICGKEFRLASNSTGDDAYTIAHESSAKPVANEKWLPITGEDESLRQATIPDQPLGAAFQPVRKTQQWPEHTYQSVAPDREETPTFAPPTPSRDLPSPSPFDGPALDLPSTTQAPPSQANLRPSAHRVPTSSTISTIKAPVFTSPSKPHTSTRPPLPRGLSNHNNTPGYPHLPPPLLHTLRESFQVLDPSNSGTLNPTSLTSTLEQLGLPNDPSTLHDFFPASGPSQLNLAKYLDLLSAPLASLSHPDELRAAFEAFDADDSGQIDVGELRHALLHTAPELGEDDDMGRLSEREVDGILEDFASRRHFGGKGVSGHGARGKGEVFRYREFMAGISGGAGGGEGAVVGA
ncbi:hypothetical protein B0A55_11173 [Friedmanniomyces simplex]|uniref:EF-hand domain-containing protein n=1 Tax=Friedmanniomyces simplex TaxID=329884 RepID=A0A4U0WTK2_9PEZI|nr:hypothetical protein B0A55_11173 [Friedmanniomyces simplex]